MRAQALKCSSCGSGLPVHVFAGSERSGLRARSFWDFRSRGSSKEGNRCYILHQRPRRGRGRDAKSRRGRSRRCCRSRRRRRICRAVNRSLDRRLHRASLRTPSLADKTRRTENGVSRKKTRETCVLNQRASIEGRARSLSIGFFPSFFLVTLWDRRPVRMDDDDPKDPARARLMRTKGGGVALASAPESTKEPTCVVWRCGRRLRRW